MAVGIAIVVFVGVVVLVGVTVLLHMVQEWFADLFDFHPVVAVLLGAALVACCCGTLAAVVS